MMRSHFCTLFALFTVAELLLNLSCTTTATNTAKTANQNTPRPSVKVPVPVLPPEQCRVFKKVDSMIPFYMNQPDANFVVTRLTKPCISRDGVRGFQPDTAWMAMGIPCSGGKGRIDIAGKSYNPKLITFNMGTDCPMLPAEPESLGVSAERVLGIGASNTLLAYNPLGVQYWENVATSDSDFGTQVNMRGSDDNLRTFWNDFKEGKRTVKVRLYGRENAWVENNTMFKIEGEIRWQSPKYFVFVPESIQVMTHDETQQALQRCITSKASKNCGDVF